MKHMRCVVIGVALAVALYGCGPSKPSGTNVPGPGGVETPPSAPPVTSPISLLDGLPENARPKSTDDTIRLDRANDWLQENAPGKRIKWDYAIGDVGLARQEKTRYYTVTIPPGVNAEKRWNIHKLHGLDWTLYIGGPGQGTIVLPDVLDDTADLLTPQENSTVKIEATIDRAYLSGGALHVLARDFVIGGVKTGLPAALEQLQNSEPADRQERIDVVMRSAGRNPDAAPMVVPVLAPLLSDKDKSVQQAAAIAILAVDPTHAKAMVLLPPQASFNGKYAKLLRVLYLPEDRASYTAPVYDSGRNRAYEDYRGHKLVPEGYWVYLPPYWYVWETEKGPEEAEKRPAELKN